MMWRLVSLERADQRADWTPREEVMSQLRSEDNSLSLQGPRSVLVRPLPDWTRPTWNAAGICFRQCRLIKMLIAPTEHLHSHVQTAVSPDRRHPSPAGLTLKVNRRRWFPEKRGMIRLIRKLPLNALDELTFLKGLLVNILIKTPFTVKRTCLIGSYFEIT